MRNPMISLIIAERQNSPFRTKRGEGMKRLTKRLVYMLTALTLAISVGACATPARDETTRVKCPACGYEFDAPMGGS